MLKTPQTLEKENKILNKLTDILSAQTEKVKMSVLSKQVYAAAALSFLSCLILCGPIDGSPPGSPAPGILQARTLEWAVISFSNA